MYFDNNMSVNILSTELYHNCSFKPVGEIHLGKKGCKMREKTNKESELFMYYVYFMASRYILDGIFLTYINIYNTIALYKHTWLPTLF
jgi:hypothetical protein